MSTHMSDHRKLGTCRAIFEDDTCRGDDAHVCQEPPGHLSVHKCSCGAKWAKETGHKADPDVVLRNDRFAGLNLNEALLASGAVKRYHTHPHVIGHPQTVAEHTFRCAAIMMSLWHEYTMSALQALLCHDGAEGAVGDISSTVKRMHPDLARIMDGIEEGVQVRVGMPVEGDQDFEAQMWIRICDWLEGAFYAIDQMAMGNRGMAMCHNAFVHSLNILPMTDDVRLIVSEAHHKYLRHPGNGGLKMELGWIDLIDRPQDRAAARQSDR